MALGQTYLSQTFKSLSHTFDPHIHKESNDDIVQFSVTKPSLKWAFSQFSVLYLWLDGRSVKNWWRGGTGLFIIVGTRHVMASSFSCDRPGWGEADHF